jgi:hypothetical protein
MYYPFCYLILILSLSFVSCSKSDPAKPSPLSQADSSLKGLASSQWVGFDHEPLNTTLILNSDGTGQAPCKLTATSNPDGSEPCAITWSIKDRRFSISRVGTLMIAEWYAFISDDKLHISTTVTTLKDKIGKVIIYASLQHLEIKNGECTHQYARTMKAHTAPCNFTEESDRFRLDYEGQNFNKKVSPNKLYWYKDAGVLASEPLYILNHQK